MFKLRKPDDVNMWGFCEGYYKVFKNCFNSAVDGLKLFGDGVLYFILLPLFPVIWVTVYLGRCYSFEDDQQLKATRHVAREKAMDDDV